jgi:hypothetical protein
MNIYEVRYHDKEDWEVISEIEVLKSLQEVFDQVTPAIQDMIQGRHILTPDAVYRIKDRL